MKDLYDIAIETQNASPYSAETRVLTYLKIPEE
jgi:hypothetical protein